MKTLETTSALKFTRTLPFDCSDWGKKSPGTLKIEIRLNDQCGNGYEDFAITAEINHPSVRRDCLAGGCLHDEILKAAPEFAPFVRLHLSDAEGAPMHAMANGFYWLAGSMPEAFPTATKPNEPAEKCAAILAVRFRMTPDEVATLQAAGIRDQLHLSAWMEAAGYRTKWKAEASAAIAKLQTLSGGPVFKSRAIRSNWPPVSPEAMADMKAKEASGYYTPEQVAARDTAKREAERAKRIAGIHADHDKRVAESLAEMQVKLFLAENDAPSGNVIYYRHVNTVTFNFKETQWRTYEKTWTREEFEEMTRKADPSKLPAGLKFEFKA